MSKPKTALDMHKIATINREVQVPWSVWRLFGCSQKIISIAGTEISLGEDYSSLDDCRKAVAWYVEQLGGKVKWEKE